LASAPLALSGLALPGLALAGLALPGLALPGLALPGLALPGLALPGLAPPGIKPSGGRHDNVAQPCSVVSNARARSSARYGLRNSRATLAGGSAGGSAACSGKPEVSSTLRSGCTAR